MKRLTTIYRLGRRRFVGVPRESSRGCDLCWERTGQRVPAMVRRVRGWPPGEFLVTDQVDFDVCARCAASVLKWYVLLVAAGAVAAVALLEIVNRCGW